MVEPLIALGNINKYMYWTVFQNRPLPVNHVARGTIFPFLISRHLCIFNHYCTYIRLEEYHSWLTKQLKPFEEYLEQPNRCVAVVNIMEYLPTETLTQECRQALDTILSPKEMRDTFAADMVASRFNSDKQPKLWLRLDYQHLNQSGHPSYDLIKLSVEERIRDATEVVQQIQAAYKPRRIAAY